MDNIIKFCNILRKRSNEHAEAIRRMHDLPGMMVSILRQELDSMVRVIYLLSINDLSERDRLISQTLRGEIWTALTKNRKYKKVTDREMVELSNQLEGWTLYVYKFGCAFIHLSNFHDYGNTNPFESLSDQEQTDILQYLRRYHGGMLSKNPSLKELVAYIPRVFEKINSNLEYHIKDLESGKVKSFTI